MEIRYVDADHGFAAFAPSAPTPSVGEDQTHISIINGTPFNNVAFRAKDTVAVEAPVVLWQQVISGCHVGGKRGRRRKKSKQAEEESEGVDKECLNAEEDGDDESVGGAGIHRSCAMCLNSLLSVEEEGARLDRLAALYASSLSFDEKKTSKGCAEDGNRRTPHDNKPVSRLLYETLDRVGVFVALTDDKERNRDWDSKDWFMTAVPSSSLLSSSGTNNNAAFPLDDSASNNTSEWKIVLRPMSTQARLVIAPAEGEGQRRRGGRSNETGNDDDDDTSSDGWTLHFCDAICLRKHQQSFNLQRWMLALEKSDHDEDFADGAINERSTNDNESAASSTQRDDAMIRSLLMQYLLFETPSSSDGNARSTPTALNGRDTEADAEAAATASTAFVTCVRNQIWSCIVGEYIFNKKNAEVSNARQQNTLLYDHRQSRVVQRCLRVINILSSTFNDRYKLVLMVICQALEEMTRQRRENMKSKEKNEKNEFDRTIRQPQPQQHTRSQRFDRLDAFLIDSFCSRYEEGPRRRYTWRQRECLRSFTALVNIWLNALRHCTETTDSNADGHDGGSDKGRKEDISEEGDDDNGKRFVSLQTVMQVIMVLDSNAHSCVVLSPLYAMATHHNNDSAGGDGSAQKKEENTSESRSTDRSQRTDTASIFELLFGDDANRQGISTVEPNESLGDCGVRKSDVLPPLKTASFSILPSLLNNMGVALYDKCTKINHSCRPNVRFIPTFAPARAHVIARGGRGKGRGSTDVSDLFIAFGEEIRTSYLDVDEEFAEQDEEDAEQGKEVGDEGCFDRRITTRRKRLKDDYGFDCDCARCLEGK